MIGMPAGKTNCGGSGVESAPVVVSTASTPRAV
jgi:hypothetical protein